MDIMFSLLKNCGKMIRGDFYPFTKIADTMTYEPPTMNYFAEDMFEGEMEHARSFEKEICNRMPKCSYRKDKLTLG